MKTKILHTGAFFAILYSSELFQCNDGKANGRLGFLSLQIYSILNPIQMLRYNYPGATFLVWKDYQFPRPFEDGVP